MKRIFVLILCAVLLLSLCACGAEDKKEETKEKEDKTEDLRLEDVAGIAPEDRPVLPVIPLKQEYTISEYLAAGRSIWYVLNGNYGKDSDVARIFVIEPNGMLYVMGNVPYSLGELARMTDGEIADMVKTEHTKQLVNEYYLLDEDKHSACMKIQSFVIEQETLWYGLYETDLDPEVLTELALQQWNDEALRQVLQDGVAEFMKVWVGFIEKLYMDRSAAEYITAMLYAYGMDYEAVLEYEIGYGVLPDGVEQDMQNMAGILYQLSEAYYDYKVAHMEAFLEAASPSPYRLTIVTDSTGNYTDTMELVYKQTYSDGSERVLVQELGQLYPAGQSGGNCTMEVYDSLYGGYYSDGSYLYTRVSKNLYFTLDAVGEKDLPLDVKDYETLFAE